MTSYRRHAGFALFAVLVLGACTTAHTVVPMASDMLASAAPSTVPVRPTGTSSPVFSPQELATRTAFSAKVATVDALYATETALLPECGGFDHYGDSPDGNWVILRCVNSGMGVYNQTDHSKAWYFSYYQLYGLPYENGNHFGYVSPVYWSADDKLLYFVARRTGDGGCALYNDGSALYRLELSSGVYSLLIPPTVGHPYGSFSFSNGDAYVASIASSPEQNPTLTLLDLRSRSMVDIPLGNRFAEGGYLIWSPDNRQVLFSAGSGGECETMTYYLVFMDLQRRTPRILWQGNSVEMLPVSWERGQATVQVVMQATGSGGLFSISLPSGEIKPHSGPEPTVNP